MPTLAAIMKPSGPLKHFAIAFVIALLVYIVSYSSCQHSRTHNGPWSAAFTNEKQIPALIINEPNLNITNLEITFPGQSAPSTNSTISFTQPQ